MQNTIAIRTRTAVTTALALALALAASAQDLHPTAVSCNVNKFRPGQKVTIKSTIQNIAFFKSTGKAVQSAYYLSESIILFPKSAIRLHTFQTPVLPARKSHKHSVQVTMPQKIKSRQYYLFVRADINGKLKEFNELNNNRWVGIKGTNTDLTASLVAPGPLTAGSTIEVTVKAKNIGTLESNPCWALLFLSKDPFITTADVYLGTVAVPKVPGNQTRSVKRKVQLPHCASYYALLGQTSLGVIINPATSKRVQEGNYDNNTSHLLRFVNASTTKGRYLEWRPTFREDGLGSTTVSQARFQLANDSAQGKMCITAPNDKLAQYLLVWSLSPKGFQWDRFTGFGIANINRIFFPNWFGNLGLTGGRNDIGLFIPRMPGMHGFTLFTYHYYIKVKGSGFGSNTLQSTFIK